MAPHELNLVGVCMIDLDCKKMLVVFDDVDVVVQGAHSKGEADSHLQLKLRYRTL